MTVTASEYTDVHHTLSTPTRDRLEALMELRKAGAPTDATIMQCWDWTEFSWKAVWTRRVVAQEAE